MVNGKPTINGTVNIIATVPASNGIIHVVDGVYFYHNNYYIGFQTKGFIDF